MRPDTLIQAIPEAGAAVPAADTVPISVAAVQAVAHKAYLPKPIDSDTMLIEAPAAADTAYAISYDMERALKARYATDGIDVGALTVEEPPSSARWEQGIEGMPRHINAGDNSGVLAIITGMFLLMMMSYRHCRKLFTTLVGELLGMRRRANVFDEHTSNETRALGLMAMQWSVYTGLLLYSYMAWQRQLSVADTLSDTLTLIGLTASYYLFQLVAYSVVGYAFSTETGSRHFVQGFTSSQSLLGFMLIVPALVSIFYPEACPEMIAVSVGLYVTARLIFIIKGFRIFYHKFSSLLYFILYLCTLEIIPLIVLYHIALSLVNSD